LSHLETLDGSCQALVDGVLALHIPFDALVHGLLFHEHADEAAGDGFE
jgi:hypothetical protein